MRGPEQGGSRVKPWIFSPPMGFNHHGAWGKHYCKLRICRSPGVLHRPLKSGKNPIPTDTTKIPPLFFKVQFGSSLVIWCKSFAEHCQHLSWAILIVRQAVVQVAQVWAAIFNWYSFSKEKLISSWLSMPLIQTFTFEHSFDPAISRLIQKFKHFKCDFSLTISSAAHDT